MSFNLTPNQIVWTEESKRLFQEQQSSGQVDPSQRVKGRYISKGEKMQRVATYVNGRRVLGAGKQEGSRIEYTAKYVDGWKVSDSRTSASSKSKRTNISKRPSGNDDR